MMQNKKEMVISALAGLQIAQTGDIPAQGKAFSPQKMEFKAPPAIIITPLDGSASFNLALDQAADGNYIDAIEKFCDRAGYSESTKPATSSDHKLNS